MGLITGVAPVDVAVFPIIGLCGITGENGVLPVVLYTPSGIDSQLGLYSPVSGFQLFGSKKLFGVVYGII